MNCDKIDAGTLNLRTGKSCWLAFASENIEFSTKAVSGLSMGKDAPSSGSTTFSSTLQFAGQQEAGKKRKKKEKPPYGRVLVGDLF